MDWLLLCIFASVSLQVTGAPPYPPVPDTLELDSLAVESFASGVLEWYLQEGYPFAAVALYLSSADTLVLNTVPGRHALLEDVRFPDSVRTRRSVLLRSLELSCGESYSSGAVYRWLRDMEKLPFIESAGPCGVSLGPGGNIILVVPVNEAPPGWFSGDMDFSSSGGFTGGGEIVFTNLFGSGRRLELYGSAAEWGGLDAAGLYREPWILGSPVSAELQASQQVPDSGSVIREWSSSLIIGLGNIEVSGGGGSWKSYPLDHPDESYRYGSAGLAWDLTESVRQGRAGFSGQVTTDAGNASSPDSTYLLTRASGALSWKWFSGALGLGLQAKGGGIISGEWLSTMVTRLGGYGSLRGYPEDSWRAGAWGILSPEISLGETPTRIYLFSDAGFLNTGEDKIEYPVSIGIGLRGVAGGLSFDAGTGFPLDRGIGSARFYMSARVSL